MNNRLARLQTGGAANQNTPKPANDNNKQSAQARLGKLSDHFNEKSGFNDKSGKSGGSNSGGAINGGGGGGDGKPPRQPVSLVKNKNKPNLNDLQQKTHEPVQIKTPVGTGVSPSHVTAAAQYDKDNQKKRSVNVNKAFTDAHNNTQKTADDNSNAKPGPHPAGGKPGHGPEYQ